MGSIPRGCGVGRGRFWGSILGKFWGHFGLILGGIWGVRWRATVRAIKGEITGKTIKVLFLLDVFLIRIRFFIRVV